MPRSQIFPQQETVFKLGDIKDPISGEMVVGPNYRLGLDLNLGSYDCRRQGGAYECGQTVWGE